MYMPPLFKEGNRERVAKAKGLIVFPGTHAVPGWFPTLNQWKKPTFARPCSSGFKFLLGVATHLL